MKTRRNSLAEIRKRFEDAGFSVIGGSGGADPMEVRKYGCVHRIERNREDIWAPATPPHFLIRGLPCELEDHGYQKFWLCNNRRFPIRLEDLRALQRFDQEVRHLLDLKSLYNESLGTTAARSAYDRLEGRPDV